MSWLLKFAMSFIPGVGPFLTLLAPLFPGISTFLQSYATAKFNAQVAITQAKVGGDVSVANAIVAAQVAAEQSRVSALGVIAGSTMLTLLVLAFAGPLVFYMWKDIGFDVIIGSFHGCSKGSMLSLSHVLEGPAYMAQVAKCAYYSTDPIQGQAAEWGNTIIWSIFGSTVATGGIAAAASIIKRNA